VNQINIRNLCLIYKVRKTFYWSILNRSFDEFAIHRDRQGGWGCSCKPPSQWKRSWTIIVEISVDSKTMSHHKLIEPLLVKSWLQVLNSPTFDNVYTVLPRSIAPPFYLQPRLSPKFSSVPISPIKNTPLYCQTQIPPQVFRHKSRKTNLNSPVSTAHNYLLTAVYWSVIMEC
jgi:hypothetical protein